MKHEQKYLCLWQKPRGCIAPTVKRGSPQKFPRVVGANVADRNLRPAGKNLCRRVVESPDPPHSGAGRPTIVGGQTQAAKPSPVCVSRGKVAVKPDYKSMILLKSCVVEGEGGGSGVARQLGGTILFLFFNVLVEK